MLQISRRQNPPVPKSPVWGFAPNPSATKIAPKYSGAKISQRQNPPVPKPSGAKVSRRQNLPAPDFPGAKPSSLGSIGYFIKGINTQPPNPFTARNPPEVFRRQDFPAPKFSSAKIPSSGTGAKCSQIADRAKSSPGAKCRDQCQAQYRLGELYLKRLPEVS